MLDRAARDSEHDRLLPGSDVLYRVEWEDPSSPPEAAGAQDDLVRVVGVPLVADAVEPAHVLAVQREDPIALGGGEQSAQLGPPSEIPFAALVPAPSTHGYEG
jgi:hypothetical protein